MGSLELPVPPRRDRESRGGGDRDATVPTRGGGVGDWPGFAGTVPSAVRSAAGGTTGGPAGPAEGPLSGSAAAGGAGDDTGFGAAGALALGGVREGSGGGAWGVAADFPVAAALQKVVNIAKHPMHSACHGLVATTALL